MANFTFNQLQNEQKLWAKHNFGDASSWHSLLETVEELGEFARVLLISMEKLGKLAHAHLKEVQKIKTDEDYVNDAKDAIANIIICLANYCSRRGWNLGTIVKRRGMKCHDWKKNRKILCQPTEH